MKTDPLVVVIDDDVALQGAIVDLVRSLGYAGKGYFSADQFCATAHVPECACIITDIEMPGMDGFAFLKRSKIQYPGIPVIMITALAAGDLCEKAMAAGAMAFLHKPFDGNALASFITKAVMLL